MADENIVVTPPVVAPTEEKKDKLSYLNQFVDAVINGDNEKMKQSISAYTNLKSIPIVKNMREGKLNETFLVELRAFGEDSPIRLVGDDVVVNNAKVGTIVNDVSNVSTGIIFRSDDGKIKKEFNTIKEFYEFIASNYKVAGEV